MCGVLAVADGVMDNEAGEFGVGTGLIAYGSGVGAKVEAYGYNGTGLQVSAHASSPESARGIVIDGTHAVSLDIYNNYAPFANDGGRRTSFIRCQNSNLVERFRIDTEGRVTALSYSTTNDRDAKTDLQPLVSAEVLAKVVALPISTWTFKIDLKTRHAGPMAQDFAAAFNLGDDPRTIATVDADGIAFAAIQGLNQKMTEHAEAFRSLLESRAWRLHWLDLLCVVRARFVRSTNIRSVWQHDCGRRQDQHRRSLFRDRQHREVRVGSCQWRKLQPAGQVLEFRSHSRCSNLAHHAHGNRRGHALLAGAFHGLEASADSGAGS